VNLDCVPSLTKISSIADGLASTCEHLGGGKYFNLESCTAEAYALDANVINMLRSHCAVKRCTVEDDYMLDDLIGGHDVYVVKGYNFVYLIIYY